MGAQIGDDLPDLTILVDGLERGHLRALDAIGDGVVELLVGALCEKLRVEQAGAATARQVRPVAAGGSVRMKAAPGRDRGEAARRRGARRTLGKRAPATSRATGNRTSASRLVPSCMISSSSVPGGAFREAARPISLFDE